MAASLKLASAKVTKVSRSRADSGATTTPTGQGSDADPWAAESPGGYSQAPPF